MCCTRCGETAAILRAAMELLRRQMGARWCRVDGLEWRASRWRPRVELALADDIILPLRRGGARPVLCQAHLAVYISSWALTWTSPQHSQRPTQQTQQTTQESIHSHHPLRPTRPVSFTLPRHGRRACSAAPGTSISTDGQPAPEAVGGPRSSAYLEEEKSYQR